MILQSSHVVVDCPICGRPLEMSSPFISREIACGHCQGKFSVVETDEGSLVAVNPKGTGTLKRAEQLLLATDKTNLPDSERCCQQGFPWSSGQDKTTFLENPLSTLPEGAGCEPKPQPIVLLVEHRDEVFTRIATDLAKFEMRVIRAKTATEALILVDKHQPVLLIGNVDLPGQSGWLMTAKLRLFDTRIRVWLYRHPPSGYGQEIAKYLDLDALLAYHGDLFGLSQTIVDRMANRPEAA